MIVRLADPERDADAVSAIYRPAVEASIASFEEVAPDAVEMARRIGAILARTPWLVVDDGMDAVGYDYEGPHRERHGYRWSVEVSVSVSADIHISGSGQQQFTEKIV